MRTEGKTADPQEQLQLPEEDEAVEDEGQTIDTDLEPETVPQYLDKVRFPLRAQEWHAWRLSLRMWGD